MRTLRYLSLTLSLLLIAGATASLADVRVDTANVPGAEGVRLATDVYHPTEEPAPAILVRTPYGRKGLAFLGEALAEHGYVVLLQDVRGKYDSTGEHEPFRHERADGLASLKWIAAQPWCNGRIGMWGSSYSGFAALAVADAELPAFQSIFSISGWLDVEQVVRPGGANHLMLNLAWMLSQQGRVQRNLNDFDIDALFRHTPMRDALKAAGIRNETWEDPSWLDDVTTADVDVRKVARPVFQLTGWHDMVYRATLDTWRRLAASGSKLPHKLAIGPWYHNQFLFGTWEVGDAHFGHASGFGTDEVVALSLRWFDATLRDRKNGALETAPVTYFLMGQNAWQPAETWPPKAGTAKQRRYLSSKEGANSSAGDGTLVTRKPRGRGEDRFSFDPENPVPTDGGANFFYFPDTMGVRDQREIERRQDVLVYTSEALEREQQIVGNVRVRLAAATSGRDTDFTAKLVVVRPDGYARIVEEGIARVSRALGREPTPGEPFRVDIDLGHTAIAVPAGHRLRLEVSSSNFPKYDRNPNTGEDAYLAAKLKTAEQTVYFGDSGGSWVELPLRGKPLVATAAGRRPLVEPVDMPAEVAAVEGDDAAKLVALGREQLEGDEVEQAIATFQRVAELAPDVSEHHYWLGRAYLDRLQQVSMFKKLGLSKKVQASYQRAIELDPDNVDAHSSLTSFYFNAPAVAGGGFDKGVAQAEQVRRLDPRAAHLLLAGGYAQRKEFDRAKQEYRAAIALEPSAGAPYYSLGLLCQQEKRWAEAFDAFEAGVREASDSRSLYQVGRTAVFSGERLDRGKQAFEQYIEQSPGGAFVPSAHWRLGMLYELMGDEKAAEREYRTSLELDPELDQARQALKTLAKSR